MPRASFVLAAFLTAGAYDASSAPAAPPSAAAQKANAAYEAGRFQDAAAAYERLVADGWTGGALLYNLGNAYVRTRQIGKAIAAYERAFRLEPRDPDIRANLAFARALIQERRLPREPLLDALKRVFHALPLEALAWLTALLWDAALLGWLLILLKRRPVPRAPLHVLSGAALAALLWLAALTATQELTPAAIVIAPGHAEARSGPGLTYDTSFTAPEGQRVLILQDRQGWVEIETTGERLKGWVPSPALEPLSPLNP